MRAALLPRPISVHRKVPTRPSGADLPAVVEEAAEEQVVVDPGDRGQPAVDRGRPFVQRRQALRVADELLHVRYVLVDDPQPLIGGRDPILIAQPGELARIEPGEQGPARGARPRTAPRTTPRPTP